MSATNSTPIINLPLFIGSDKPAWLTDWNGAMNTIDTAIANLQTAESGTATSLASLAQSVEALSGTVSQHTTAIQTVTNATAGNTGSINTINSLIGNGEPTTEDKTIIGAINEIYAEIGGGTGVDAEDVVYSNTSSGLTATNVQAAIDEVNAKIPAGGAVEADDVSYDNTASGLTATNIQSAVDEIASGNKWKAVSDITALPADYDELFISALNTNGEGSTCVIAKAAIPTSGNSRFKHGSYYSNSDNMTMGVAFNGNTAITAITLDIGGQSVSNPVTTVLYR